MTITVTVELDNDKILNFQSLETIVHETVNAVGCAVMQRVLEQKDDEILEVRDSARFRNKGKRQTSVRTPMGIVEYSRRVYTDILAVGSGATTSSRYLLDEMFGIKETGLISPELCQIIARNCCEASFRSVAQTIFETTGVAISHTGVWNVVQQLGRRERARVDRLAELAKIDAGAGVIETKILFEETDGIFLSLQGASRKNNGPKKEMRIAIDYDGVLYTQGKNGVTRRKLDAKTAFAMFGTVAEFRAKNEGVVANVYDVDSIELRVKNGDGASWIQKAQEGADTITVLDKYHRNKKITECVRDAGIATNICNYLYAQQIDEMFEYMELTLDTMEDGPEKVKFQELYGYFDSNRDGLLGYYDRGIAIPETREPGVIHHARLGSMESNVFTLIGNRMKGRRRNWSIEGGNNLAALLALRHTTGFEGLFNELPSLPDMETVSVDEGRVLGSRENPKTVGHGYEFYNAGSLTLAVGNLNNSIQHVEISNLKFI